jgi:phage tail protein X
MQVRSIQGDTVDQLCWRHLRTTNGVVEQTYSLNRGLADLGPVLPSGTIVVLPDLQTQTAQQQTVQLWD